MSASLSDSDVDAYVIIRTLLDLIGVGIAQSVWRLGYGLGDRGSIRRFGH
jgi:hypothetical protein